MKLGTRISGRTILACLISFAFGALVTSTIYQSRLKAPNPGSGVLAPIPPANTFPPTAVSEHQAADAPEPLALAPYPGTGSRERKAPRVHQVSARASAPLTAPVVSAVSAVPAHNPPAEHNFFAESPTFTMKGKVSLRGVPPPEKALPLGPNCAKEHPNGATTKFYVVSEDGGLADVVVFLSAGVPDLNWPMPQNPHVLRQPGCLYEPYISACRAGQIIQIQNLSPVVHNVHFTPTVRGNREVNLAQLPNAKPLELTLAAPELFVRLKCDVHPWEYAYVSTFSHPYFAVTDENGEFELPQLPAGEYTLKALHRKVGGQEISLNITKEPEPLALFFQVPEEI